MKWYTLLILIIVILPFAQGSICEEIIEPLTTCQMVTPTIVGTNYSYQVLLEGVVNESGTMAQWNDGSYYFNFTKSNGTYLIKTSEWEQFVYVRETEVSSMAIDLSIIIGIIAFIIIFLYIAFNVGEEHWVFKSVLIIFSVFLILLIPRYLHSVNPSDITVDLVKYSTRMAYLFVIYVLIYGLWKVFDYYGKTDGIKQWIEDNFKNKDR